MWEIFTQRNVTTLCSESKPVFGSVFLLPFRNSQVEDKVFINKSGFWKTFVESFRVPHGSEILLCLTLSYYHFPFISHRHKSWSDLVTIWFSNPGMLNISCNYIILPMTGTPKENPKSVPVKGSPIKVELTITGNVRWNMVVVPLKRSIVNIFLQRKSQLTTKLSKHIFTKKRDWDDHMWSKQLRRRTWHTDFTTRRIFGNFDYFYGHNSPLSYTLILIWPFIIFI